MNGYQYGGFWRRLIAISIDGLLLHGIVISLFFATQDLFIAAGRFGVDSMSVSLIGIVYTCGGIVLNMAYFTFFHGTGGRTPGKMVMGLKVVRSNGAELTPGFAFLRWVGYQVSRIFLMLGFLWVAFDARKQGWHDKIADTVVIKTRGMPVHDLIDDSRAYGTQAVSRISEHPATAGQRNQFPY